MANVIIQIYGIRTVEDARMVIDMGGHHIGVSYGKIKRTPGQLMQDTVRPVCAWVTSNATAHRKITVLMIKPFLSVIASEGSG